jgi:hypothetical protein
MLAVARDLVRAEVRAADAPVGDHEARADLGRHRRRSEVATTFEPTAMRLLEDTLAKGCVKMLARLGGARARVRAHAGSRRPMRVFEARPTPRIAFGRYTFELVRWLTSTVLDATSSPVPLFESAPVSVGDELCAYLALRLVEGGPFERSALASPGLRCGLTWLGFSRSLASHGERSVTPDLTGIVATEERRVVLECLAGDLAPRWALPLRSDAREDLEAEDAAYLGAVERATADGLLDALAAADRWDLATFLVDAGVLALPVGRTAQQIAAVATPRVTGGTLRAKTEARRQGGALFRALARLGKKREALALVGFMDDGYEAAQATLSAWEPMGRGAFARAEEVVALLDSLDGA